MSKDLSNRRKIEKQRRHDYIIEKATELFYEKDFANTTITEIAKKCGYSVMGLYKNITSKEELYLEVYYNSLKERLQIEKEYTDKEKKGFEKLKAQCKATFHYFKDNPGALKHLKYADNYNINTDNINSDLLENISKDNVIGFNNTKEFLNLGIKDGSIKADTRVDYFALQLTFSLRNIIYMGIFIEDGFSLVNISNPDDWVNYFLDTYLNSIKNN